VVAIWQELDRESPSRLTEEVLAWLWLLDRRNHALLSGSPPRVLTTPHRYAARRVRDWYGVPEADAAGGGAKKAVRVWRRGVRQAIVLGLVVLLEDRGSNADWDGLAPDVCFVVGTSVDSRAVKEKCAELERQGTPWEFVDVGSAPGPNLASRVAARLQVPLNSSVEV